MSAGMLPSRREESPPAWQGAMRSLLVCTQKGQESCRLRTRYLGACHVDVLVLTWRSQIGTTPFRSCLAQRARGRMASNRQVRSNGRNAEVGVHAAVFGSAWTLVNGHLIAHADDVALVGLPMASAAALLATHADVDSVSSTEYGSEFTDSRSDEGGDKDDRPLPSSDEPWPEPAKFSSEGALSQAFRDAQTMRTRVILSL